jgi:hypothetical protein
MSYLLLFDADQISGYVFATGRLREIRGASTLVREATEAKRFVQYELRPYEIGDGGEVVYAAGGGGLLLLDDRDRALAVAEQLMQAYRQQTGSGSLTTSIVAWDGQLANFRWAIQQAVDMLQRNKAGRGSAAQRLAGGAIAFCDSCRQEPAAKRDAVDGALVCLTCYKKRDRSKDMRRNLIGQAFWQQFVQDSVHPMPDPTRTAWEGEMVPVPDFGDIGARSRPRGYLGFCHADGDGVGRLLEQVDSPDEYYAFSHIIEDAVNTALGTALRQVYAEPTSKDWRTPRDYSVAGQAGHPFEVIAVGGDDMLVVATADGALLLAAIYCRVFSEQMQARVAAHPALASWRQRDTNWQKDPVCRFSASAGVVIAHDTMPIVTLRDRAKELLKNAKHMRVYRIGQGGMIDFHMATTPTLNAISEIRRDEYTIDEHPNGATSLVGRPYRVTDFPALLTAGNRLRTEVPPTKRADLYAALFQTSVAAGLDVLRLQARLPPKGREALLDGAARFGWLAQYPYGPAPGGTPWQRFTGLVDLLEVAELGPELVAQEGT